MKKIILFNFGMAIVIAGLFGACSKEQKINVGDQDNIARQLKFIPVNESVCVKPVTLNKEVIIIVQWEEWGRAKKECRGWGLCKAEWFPQFKDRIINPHPGNGGAAILEFDLINSQYYFDILLADKPEPRLTLLDLALVVDYDIDIYTQTRLGNDLRINQGIYNYDGSMGTFGGYRIYLDTI